VETFEVLFAHQAKNIWQPMEHVKPGSQRCCSQGDTLEEISANWVPSQMKVVFWAAEQMQKSVLSSFTMTDIS